MQAFGANEPRTRQSFGGVAVDSNVNVKLNMYLEPPTADVTLDRFMDLGSRRHKLLGELQKSFSPEKIEGKWEQNAEAVIATVRACELMKFEDDQQSHFVLRLAHCGDEDHRQVFLKLETQLFRWRCHAVLSRVPQDFIKCARECISSVEEATPADPAYRELQAFIIGSGGSLVRAYKLNFTDAPEVVMRRQCVLHGGVATIAEADMISVLTAHFRANLSRLLTLTFKRMGSYLSKPNRLTPALQLAKQDAIHASSFVKTAGSLTVDQVPAAADQSFPLCMHTMYTGLKADKHMKNEGRQEFGLFLKSAGLPLSEAVNFWRSAFYPRTTADKFDKQYAYQFRYMYGQEGKRTDFSAYGCHTIGSHVPNPGEHHGCPFVYAKEEQLRALVEKRLASRAPTMDRIARNEVVREILELAKGKHNQIACARLFMHTHGGTELTYGARHPNEYYKESREYLEAMHGHAAEQAAVAAVLGEAEAAAGRGASSGAAAASASSMSA